MDIRQKRKLIEVLRGLIGDGYTGTQKEIAKELKRHGFAVTQATVSRVMKQVGVTKEFRGEQSTYRIAPKGVVSFRGSIADLVLELNHNGSLVVVKTTAGSAMFVAGFVDHECSDIVLGTVAGDDAIFVAPRNIKDLDKVVLRLHKILKQ